MRLTKKYISETSQLAVIGFLMGAANLVPGVSGGTIAFIFGIYERLIDVIKLVTGEVLKLFMKGKISQAFNLIPWTFLIALGGGVLASIVALSHVLEYLLKSQPVGVWAFFFGLVLSSIWLVSKRIKRWTYKEVITMLIAIAGSWYLVGLVPVNTPENLVSFFFAGAIAICAMIVPGLSGSYLLILMGKYHQILAAVNDGNYLVLVAVALGAVLGLAVFARVLSYLFKHYHNMTVAFLIGFMIGSLKKIWPWKEVVEWTVDRHGDQIPLIEQNIIPQTFSWQVMLALFLVVLGAYSMIWLEKFQQEPEK